MGSRGGSGMQCWRKSWGGGGSPITTSPGPSFSFLAVPCQHIQQVRDCWQSRSWGSRSQGQHPSSVFASAINGEEKAHDSLRESQAARGGELQTATPGPGYPQPRAGYETLHYNTNNDWSATGRRQPCSWGPEILAGPGQPSSPRNGTRAAESFIINDSTDRQGSSEESPTAQLSSWRPIYFLWAPGSSGAPQSST